MSQRILVVEDDAPIVRTLRINLRARGYEVDIATSGRAALAAVDELVPDLILLDLGLPDIDGVEVLRRVRRRSDVPIVVLTARSDADDKVEALDEGADDYVTKPFGIDELLARVRANLRRSLSAPAPLPPVHTDDFDLDFAALQARRDGRPVRLTPTEWKLLSELARHHGTVIPHTQLLQAVWGPAYGREANYLRVYANQLRRKLEPDPSHPRYLITEAGMGYCLRW